MCEPGSERGRAEEFLQNHLPQSDLDCYPWALFEQFLDHALMLRETAPWCAALDWELFAHYVLFPRVNDEDLSFHRKIFFDALWPRVKDLPAQEERVLEVNRWCHEHASYQMQDERTASPLTVYRGGSGRCGEESAFLVAALRSVGIAARQVYAPRWSHCDDNHAWVEALCGGRWRFLGACEPEPVLDRGWFTTAASRTVLVRSRIFGEGSSPLHGEALGRTGEARWFSQTARYTDVKGYTFTAILEDGRPAAGAEFELQILNGAAFHTIAVLSANEKGRARARLGRGSLHVLAHLGGLTAEEDCGEAGAVLRLAVPERRDRPWTDFNFYAPADSRPAPGPLSEAEKAGRAEVLRRGNALRQARLEGFYRPGRAGCEDLLRAARGNCGELAAFLSGGAGESRERLVRTLSDKDLRDVSAALLEEHFTRLPPRSADVPEEIYWSCVACPRIALERLTPWREPLLRWLKGAEDRSPSALWEKLAGGLEMREGLDGVYWPPAAALRAGACDRKSLDLLFVAMLRAQGVPARLRPLDGAPEYWAEGGFRSLLSEAAGVLRVTGPAEENPQYGRDWSLSRREEEGWRLLTVAEDWRDGAMTLRLPAGRYRAATSVRLPAGDQLAADCELELRPGETRGLALRIRPWAVEDLLGRQSLPALPAVTLAGERVPDIFQPGPVLAVWLEEGGEPTEHLLNELVELRETLAALPVRVIFLLRGRDSLSQPTLAGALARLEGVKVLLDDWGYDLEAVARQLGRDPDAPPLAVLADGAGRGVYSVGGYQVGAGALLLRVAGKLAEPE